MKLDFKKIENYIISFLLTAIVAAVALLFTDMSSDWFKALVKPPFQPPEIVFPIAWTIIYILCAISLGKAIECRAGKDVYVLFGIQGFLNILWCLVFFTLRQMEIGFIVVLCYLIVDYLTVRALYKHCRCAAWILAPTLLWLLFATVLNYSIVLLN